MTDLPYCTECNIPREKVWYLSDGTTMCTECLEWLMRQSERVPEIHEWLKKIRGNG